MALFSSPLPTTTKDQLENLYSTCNVDRAIIFDLASDPEVPENVREGYCGAYLSFFETCGLSIPILRQLLKILAELGISFSQMRPNFLRQLLAILVRTREENLLFGLDELRHLFVMKRKNQSPGTFLMSPRPGRHVIEGITYRDEKWREQFFVFKVNSASMGDFSFSRLPKLWAEDMGRVLFLYIIFILFSLSDYFVDLSLSFSLFTLFIREVP